MQQPLRACPVLTIELAKQTAHGMQKKKTSKASLHVSLALVLAMLSEPLSAWQKKSLALVGAEIPPYISRYIAHYGPYAELVQAALKRGGFETTMSTMQWSQALQEVEHTTFDALIGAAYSPTRARLFYYSEPYTTNRISFLKKKSLEVSWTNIGDLSPYKFAAIQDGFVSKAFGDSSGLDVEFVSDSAAVVRMVTSNHVDLGAVEEVLARSILEKHFPISKDNYDFVAKPASITEIHIIVSRRNPLAKEIIGAFNRGLAAMIADGSYHKKMKQYGLQRAVIAPRPE